MVDRHGERVETDAPLSARHRAWSDAVGPAEVALCGPRLVAPEPGGSIVALWDGGSRYTARRAGYHGGASPAEFALLLSPTAGGKTEAACLPILSALPAQAGPAPRFSISPLKELLNNLAARIDGYAQWLGRRAALWHGTPRGRGAAAAERSLASLREGIVLRA